MCQPFNSDSSPHTVSPDIKFKWQPDNSEWGNIFVHYSSIFLPIVPSKAFNCKSFSHQPWFRSSTSSRAYWWFVQTDPLLRFHDVKEFKAYSHVLVGESEEALSTTCWCKVEISEHIQRKHAIRTTGHRF